MGDSRQYPEAGWAFGRGSRRAGKGDSAAAGAAGTAGYAGRSAGGRGGRLFRAGGRGGCGRRYGKGGTIPSASERVAQQGGGLPQAKRRVEPCGGESAEGEFCPERGKPTFAA